MGTDSSTESEIDLFCEFLETAFHTILSSRKIYSSELFEPQMVYNVPITYCTHEEIMKYISSCLSLVKDLLLKQQANEIIFNIINSEKRPLERFVFNIHSHLRISRNSEAEQMELIQDFRTAVLKIISSASRSNSFPKNCSFTIQVLTSKDSFQEVAENSETKSFPWKEADNYEALSSANQTSNGEIIPLKTTVLPSLKVQMYLENFDIS